MWTLKDYHCISMMLFFGVLLPKSMSANIRIDPTMVTSDSGANKIKICANEMILVTERPSKNAFVKCYDKDPNKDDIMVEGFTGNDGCATLTYKKQSWDGWYGVGNPTPDIYCTVNKVGFVQACPPNKDHHKQSKLADFGTVTLYRDRTGDYGRDNGCGPEFAEKWGINHLVTDVTGFGEQCANHDICYSDCQIFLAKKNAKDAQEFCDKEMYEGMKSNCNANAGSLLDIEQAACLRVALRIYQGLQALGGTMAYDKSPKNCPNKDGKPDPSMKNDYSHNKCYVDGYGCGYYKTFFTDKEKCKSCCAGSNLATYKSNPMYHNYYCKCFPRDLKCGSTFFMNKYNNCDKCCGGYRKDDGWTYDDFYCE